MNNTVLVLNQNYEPLNICNIRRALILVIGGKAEVLEEGPEGVATTSAIFPAPSVIRLVYFIRRPRPRVKLSRREIFLRDSYTCQYCGRQSNELTVDHIVPRSRGGAHEWENVISACKPCNHSKGQKSLAEARMSLKTEPHEPRAGQYYTIERRLSSSVRDDWAKFLPGFTPVERYRPHAKRSNGSRSPV